MCTDDILKQSMKTRFELERLKKRSEILDFIMANLPDNYKITGLNTVVKIGVDGHYIIIPPFVFENLTAVLIRARDELNKINI